MAGLGLTQPSSLGHGGAYGGSEGDEVEEEDLRDPQGPTGEADLFASADEEDEDEDEDGMDSPPPFEEEEGKNKGEDGPDQRDDDDAEDGSASMAATEPTLLPSSSVMLPSTAELPASSLPSGLGHTARSGASFIVAGTPLMMTTTAAAAINGGERTVLPPPPSDDVSYPGDYDWEGIDSALGIIRGAGEGLAARSAPALPTLVLGEDATLTELETAGHSLAEIVGEPRFRRRIVRDYQRFLTTFTDEAGHSIYASRIRAMCAANGESLEVSYVHLVESNAFLAKLVANVPGPTLAIFDEATMRIVLRLFEEYDRIRPAIHVRITDLPSCDALRDLRYSHLGTLVRVAGVVTRRSGVFPQLQLVKYDCGKCGAILGPFVQDLQQEIRITACAVCEGRGPFTVNTQQTVYRNYQKLTLQESPGSVPAGRLPRHKDVILLYDLIDCARPGELIEVTGIYRNNFSYALNNRNGFPVFATVIEANYVSKRADEFAEFRLTEEDQREIRRLAEDPLIGLRIIRSIAPSIYGHHDVKTAIALSLFGGQPKNAQGKHAIRGDINVLLLGDPGTAKSQFLKYVEKTALRAVYATGQGASAVGLTASVRKDPITREWTLEGGALVLADKGVCCIDEFDKMNEADRTSIHEAMEQQSISVSKAGIVASLQARCAIIAAANPIRGRYNASLPFGQNVNLTEPILSRFDVLCVVRDTVDAAADERLAKFVVGSHIRSHPYAQTSMESSRGAASSSSVGLSTPTLIQLADNLQAETLLSNVEPLPQTLLKKYIMYAKSRVRPELTQVDVDKIARLYADLRRESLATGSIPITVRHIESMVRMAEAHARMHLRDFVRSDDIDVAIRVMLESFVASQKFSVMTHLKRSFAKYITQRRETGELLAFALQDLLRERARYLAARAGTRSFGRPAREDDNGSGGEGEESEGVISSSIPPSVIEVEMADLEARARELHIYDLKPFYTSRAFIGLGCRVDNHRRVIIKE